MNHSLFKNLKHNAAYSLSESERSAMRAHLITRMREADQKRAASPWFLYLMRPLPLAAFSLTLVVSCGSVSFAAGGALPGELLYGVKVAVNERVELALASSFEAKANVRVRHAEERLREAEVLAARGALTQDAAADAAAHVKASVGAANEIAVKLEAQGNEYAAEDIHMRIASALSAHSELLDAHAKNFAGEPRLALKSLSQSVRATAPPVPREKREDLDGAHSRMSAETARARAKERIAALADRMRKNGIPDESETEFAREYERLAAEIETAEEFTLVEDFTNAVRAYEDVGRRAQRALTWLKSAQEISEETDQEVIVVFDVEDENAVVAREQEGAEAAATMLMSLDAAPLIEELNEEPRSDFRLKNKED